MFSIDHPKFFADFTPRTGIRLTGERQDALSFLLSRLENDDGFTMLRELAYVLATVRWETMHSFAPIKERRFSRAKTPREWERQNRYWQTGYYGRGYVQITWEDNYKKAGQRLAGMKFSTNGSDITVDAATFTQNPDYVLHPDAAYAIASRGMREGWFTGKRLSNYIQENTPPDYVNARRIINGTDHAQDIAGMASQFELLLRAST